MGILDREEYMYGRLSSRDESYKIERIPSNNTSVKSINTIGKRELINWYTHSKIYNQLR